jgi:hypothetical protein
MTVPVMELRWGRVGYLASVVFPTFEHIHGITEFPIRPVECGSASASRIAMGNRSGYAARHEDDRIVAERVDV